ncbi:YqaJ viral recombinase family protein [Amycolatopsis sp. CFH S0078]|uniref:YqaJ viral recombinase family nuclease n=1 Tax=Amycolatopsis sp. CFH S0078 TaxID=1644108 RepID=UPI00106EBF16|nr:YqaJ viral recombinase family protein [Amycolatopsis sp. CFH S0078]
MTAVYLGDWPAGSPEWHEARRRGVGGSEIAAILGLSPWESRFSIWHRKMGLAAPVVENDVMYWGKKLEDVVRGEFNDRHCAYPDEVEGAFPAAMPIGTWRHSDRPWQIANPDGMIHHWADQGVLSGRPWMLYEGKTAYNSDGWGEPGTDEIPVYYRTQCLWYLDVFGLDVCHVAVLISGSDYREYVVEYSADEVRIMLDAAREFLGTLERNERPDIDAHDATYQVVREMHPEIDDVKVDVPGHIAMPYLDAYDAYREAAEDKQRTTAALADFMGTARRAYFDGEQIAMRVAGRGVDSPPSVKRTASTKTPGLKVSAA